MPTKKKVTVELAEKELEMLNKMREEEKLNALALKYDNASVAKLKKEYINEFGTDPMTDFVKDADTGELGERFVECISRELLIELYLEHVSQRDLKEWFNLLDGKEFMIERLIDRKISQE